MKYEAAIFDLDGTLLNTLEDLTDSLNHVLIQSGYPDHTIEEVRQFVGNGIRMLIERSVPANTPTKAVDALHQSFLSYYGEHCMEKTKPYEGILRLLHSLKNAGCKIAVVSNKADYAVQILCRTYFETMLDIALGEQSGTPKKPAPNLVFQALDALQVTPSKAVYIGDSDVDILTARNSGMDEIIVDWGFRDRSFLIEQNARVIVSTPEEIFARITTDTLYSALSNANTAASRS